MIAEVRERMVAEGDGPLDAHLPAILAERSAISEESWTISPGKNADSCESVFMPGRSLSAYSPELVQRTYSYLADHLGKVGIALVCCGGPSQLIGRVEQAGQVAGRLEEELISLGAKQIITACPYCTNNLSMHFTKIKVVPLYPVLMDLESDLHSGGKGTFSLHDPCTARGWPDVHDAVRFLIVRSGNLYEEPEDNRERSQCCGMGGMVMLANPTVAISRSERATRGMDHDIVTYCCSCRDMFSAQGHRSLHLLDLLFSQEPSGQTPAPRDAATREANTRRLNRWIRDL